MNLFKISACTAEDPGDRSEQQDRVAILTSPRNPGAMMAIVADGMGGRSGGRLAADQVVATARALFNDLSESDASPRDLLRQIAAEAHTVIRLTAISAEKEPHSTIVALHLRRDHATWAHAGDSRLYFFRGGRLAHRTADHTFAAKLRDEGKTAEAAIADDRYRNVVTSALGIAREPTVVIDESANLQVADAFVLCSDGVWTYFKDDEFGDIVHRLTPREACEQIIKLARIRAAGRGDNLSLAIVKLEPRDEPGASAGSPFPRMRP